MLRAGVGGVAERIVIAVEVVIGTVLCRVCAHRLEYGLPAHVTRPRFLADCFPHFPISSPLCRSSPPLPLRTPPISPTSPSKPTGYIMAAEKKFVTETIVYVSSLRFSVLFILFPVPVRPPASQSKAAC